MSKSVHVSGLGAKIRDQRVARGYSQVELGGLLALAVGRTTAFSQALISDIERGRVPVDVPTLDALENVLGGPGVLSSSRTPREPSSWAEWKAYLALPKHFPQLRDLEDDELDEPDDMGRDRTRRPFGLRPCMYLGGRRALLEEILVRSAARARPLVVTFPEGHGCSTASRYVHRRAAQEAGELRRIPVHIGLSQIIDARNLELSLDSLMAEQLRCAVLRWDAWQIAFSSGRAAQIRADFDRLGGDASVDAILTFLAVNFTNGWTITVSVDGSLGGGRVERSWSLRVLAVAEDYLRTRLATTREDDLGVACAFFVPTSSLEAVTGVSLPKTIEYPAIRPVEFIEIALAQCELLDRANPRGREVRNWLDHRLLRGIAGSRFALKDTARRLEGRLIAAFPRSLRDPGAA